MGVLTRHLIEHNKYASWTLLLGLWAPAWVEDYFSKLASGKTFTKLDLSQAYLQLPLEEEPKEYVVINTHMSLFRYNRLSYGVLSAPGIFQRYMENLLQGIPNVVVYLGDILIMGKTESEHSSQGFDKARTSRVMST